MEPETTVIEPSAATSHRDDDLAVEDLLEDELLVEEVSIDGMCGVY